MIYYRHLVIRYDPENGTPVADAKAEAFVTIHTKIEAMPEIDVNFAAGSPEREAFMADAHLTVSTENAVNAARCLRKEGDLDSLVFLYGDEILVCDRNGRLDRWPEGFCDATGNWLVRLV